MAFPGVSAGEPPAGRLAGRQRSGYGVAELPNAGGSPAESLVCGGAYTHFSMHPSTKNSPARVGLPVRRDQKRA